MKTARSRSPWMPLMFVVALWLAAPVVQAGAPSDRDIDRILSSLPEQQRSLALQQAMQKKKLEQK